MLCSTFSKLLLAIRVLLASRNFQTQSPKDTTNTYASFLRIHFFQQTPHLSRGAERRFMEQSMLRLITPQHILLPLYHQETHNCDSKLLTFIASGPNLIAYSLLTHLPFQLSNISPSSTGPGLLTSFLLLETRHYYPHAQTCRLSSFLSSKLSYFLFIQTLRTPGFQSHLLFL